MEQYLFDTLPDGPFSKLRKLVSGITPKLSLLDMSIGEPKHPFPSFVNQIIVDNMAGFGKYPAALGIEPLLNANANWLNNRFDLNNKIVKDQHISVLNGTREGLFNAALLAIKSNPTVKPLIAIPDPFYQVYAAAAMAGQADILFMPTPQSAGFLPVLEHISDADWQRMAVFYICSPANPQGVFADEAYYKKLIALARKHNFFIFSDECYSEIYSDEAPISALQVALNEGEFKNVISFFSLSKRSSLPGLRSGFCAGDKNFIARFKMMRNIAGAQVPLPLQHVAAAAWSDETHVIDNRNKYNQKFDLVDKILGTMFGYTRPKGGFFLWLDMAEHGGGIKAAQDLWAYCGIKSLPGAYLSNLAAEDDADQTYADPKNETASRYLRLALVGSLSDTEEALNRIVKYYSTVEGAS
ncbi:MAG: aminotransferase class I/II-fold pyridoxal phosphate-dependent enzyme [Rhizobiales bacterium]|nr:aminotransferase class I/II-fold pyridoxal phosphate-dependent enzyme [Hyphomicrobiales bacterium]